ncbi:dihydropteroate synthase [Abyssibius alkaniclasticus]|uniref:dihydropteroate synthase n=1 Tax=Abyssibius alkaniclasticus TaxID=2881234 RepID=UPI0040583F19
MGYYRPLLQRDACRPAHSAALGGGPLWFDHAELLSRDAPPRRVTLADIPADSLARLTTPRPDICGLSQSRPVIMGILNVTPDSFSDGGRHFALNAALDAAQAMAENGADILDIGGESTRPGAAPVSEDEELGRIIPVIAALREQGFSLPISVDTRKANIARAALAAGANLVNDVAALGYDADMPATIAAARAPVCLMHALGDPRTMQQDPRYDDVLLDVYDFLETRMELAAAAGIPRSAILADPGIGFGKTLDHNLALIRGLALFHMLGCPLLLGTSRKRFIGTIGGVEAPAQRVPGSLATALAGLDQGVQWLRVHDVAETRQAVALWRAILPEHTQKGAP